MKIIITDNMHSIVDIDSFNISYSNIRGLHTPGNGCSLRLSEKLEHKRGEIIDICGRIADLIYELQDIEKGE